MNTKWTPIFVLAWAVLAVTRPALSGNGIGACCIEFEADCFDTDEASCDFDFDGDFQGTGTDCASGVCGYGACCGGTTSGCGDLTQGGYAFTEQSCTGSGGTFLGVGSTCATSTAECPTGSCCIFGHCSESYLDAPFPDFYSQAGCESYGGSYLGDGSTCSINACDGACCIEEDAQCIDTDEDDCRFNYSGDFHDIGTDCASDACGYGACCGGTTSGCGDLTQGGYAFTEQSCTGSGGTFLGVGSTCAESNDVCPTGSCCTFGQCSEQNFNASEPDYWSQQGCEAQGGGYLGDGSTCDFGACNGACCVDEQAQCFDTDEASCDLNFDGDFQGIGTDCASGVCGYGACCGGTTSGCGDLTQNGFAFTEQSCTAGGGTFLGVGSTCAESKEVCPTGSCCVVAGECLEQNFNAQSPDFWSQAGCEAQGGSYLGDGTTCNGETCEIGACCGECDCSVMTATLCESQGGVFQGADTTCNGIICDTIPPELICPEPITLANGARVCNNRVDDWESSFSVSDNCPGSITVSSDLADCGAPAGQSTTVTWTATDAAGNMTACSSELTVPESPRFTSTGKGSLLTFSKVEIKWNADGSELLQDTFLSIANDYPEGVAVQAYFINGDIVRQELRDGAGTIIQHFEPGWNTADCLFTLTGNQPHSWSAANGSDKCQPFTVLDNEGPGRPDPETNGATRILRGYVVMWAVAYDDAAGLWEEVQWNHLEGSGVLVNYALGTAWEYSAWAAQARCGVHGEPVLECAERDSNGTCCVTATTPGALALDGFSYDMAFDTLLFDFYGSGSSVLSGGGRTVSLDTDLTIHPATADLRQDGTGPVLTKVDADVWNEYESKFSGARRCICCWDQTLVSNWSQTGGIPNYFMRTVLGTDKGKARFRADDSIECDYSQTCGIDPPTRALAVPAGPDAILGLAAKFISFNGGGAMAHDAAGINLTGNGRAQAHIRTDAATDGLDARRQGTKIEGHILRDVGDDRSK